MSDINKVNVNLSVCGEACNCVKCRVSEFSVEYKEPTYIPSPEEVDQAVADATTMNENMSAFGTIDVPKPVKFYELADGAHFMIAAVYGYGSQEVYQKTLEDGTNYNAISVNNTNMGHDIAPYIDVIPVKE